MPNFVSFTIKDGSAVPADVSYLPEILSSAETTLVDRREASRDMQPTIELRFDPASSRRKTFKVQRDVSIPLVRVVSGVPVVTDIMRARTVYTIPASATEQERKHLQAAVVNAESHTIAKAAVVNLDPIY